MTEEQFNKFLAIQLAQLTMLQGIHNNLRVIASTSGRGGGYNWKDTEKDIRNAMAVLDNL